jgi:hypothetical protein
LNKSTGRWLGTLLAAALFSFAALPPRAARGEDAEEVPVLGGKASTKELPDGTELDALAAKAPRELAGLAKSMKEALAKAAEHGAGVFPSFAYTAAVGLAVVPDAGLVFTRGSFESFLKIRAADESAIREHGERCRLVAMLLERRTPSDTIRLAAAFGRLAHAWSAFLDQQPVRAAKVIEAATTVQSANAGLPVKTWHAFVQAAVLHGATDAQIAAWADGEIARLIAAAPADPAAKRMAAYRDLARAYTLAVKNDKEAGAAMTKALLPLVPEEAIAADDGAFVRLYNNSVTASRRAKLPVKAPYRTKKATSTSGLVVFELPRHTGWIWQRGDGNQDDASWVRDRGASGKTEIHVWKYKTTTDYHQSDGKVIGGDNLGGRLKSDFEDDKASLVKVRRASPAVGKISRGLPSSRGYEVAGTDAQGTECLFQEWFFKSDVQRSMLNISVRREGKDVEDDPEIDFILETMTEPEAPKSK